MVKRPRSATASLAVRTTSSAAAPNSSCGVVSTRISTEAVKGSHSTFTGADRGATGRSQETGLFVGDDVYRHGFNQRSHTSFIEKCLHEDRAFQFGQNLRGNA